jgi:hypothetical protein
MEYRWKIISFETTIISSIICMEQLNLSICHIVHCLYSLWFKNIIHKKDPQILLAYGIEGVYYVFHMILCQGSSVYRTRESAWAVGPTRGTICASTVHYIENVNEYEYRLKNNIIIVIISVFIIKIKLVLSLAYYGTLHESHFHSHVKHVKAYFNKKKQLQCLN